MKKITSSGNGKKILTKTLEKKIDYNQALTCRATALNAGSLFRMPQVVLTNPYLPSMFQIYMCMSLLRT